MSGLKLKSGADFCNLEAFRMRLHNKGEDPTSDFGDGQIYFNTSDTSVGSARHVRLYDGTNFRSLAYLDEIAKNADFLALKDKVDTLIGDGVDMDGIIESWKEVEAFLSGMSDTKSLMDLLNGKLNTSGGTIDSGSNFNPLVLKSNAGTTWLKFVSNDGASRFIGVSDSNELKFQYGGASYPILHSGNIGEYAFTPRAQITSNTDADTLITNGVYLNATGNGSGNSNFPSEYSILISAAQENIYAAQISIASNFMHVRRKINTWSDWKTIAFTDSDITGTAAKAKNLVDSEGKSVVYVSGNTFYIGDSIYSTTSTQILGKDVRLRYGANASFGFWLNESGNVTIGGSDLAGTEAKLHIEDTRESSTYLLNARFLSPNLLAGGTSTIVFGKSESIKNRAYIGYCHNSDGSDNNAITFGFYGKDKIVNFLANGNVLIGTTTDSGEKLQVAGTWNDYTSLAVFEKKDSYDAKISIKNTVDRLNLVLNRAGNAYVSVGGQHSLVFETNNTERMTITGSGNVLIGTTDDNGSGARLQVAGDISIPNNHYIAFSNTAKTPLYQLWMTGNDVFFVGRGSVENGHDSVYCGKTIRFAAGDSAWNNSASIDEEGNFHISGNLIVDGEVSAGGRAEEGGNAGSGAGAFHSESIAVGATQTTIAHGLGTDDIVVSIYEKDGVSGRWSLILTDVEVVDANNIIVSFGSATSVEHKVVIMGAVA